MVSFVSAEKRDALAERLKALAYQMNSACDQGHHHQIYVHQEMIEDVLAAAAIVRLVPISPNKLFTEHGKKSEAA